MTNPSPRQLRAPLSMETSNAGFYDRWTCPACYADLDATSPGFVECEACGHEIDLCHEMVTCCVARVVMGAA